jgi:methionyl aminopeptidase
MVENYKENFAKLKISGKLAADALDAVTSHVKPGVSTAQLDKICYEFIKDNGGYSAPLFYRGFPKSCCTSVNHVICHGIPGNKYLNEGDIINIDVTAIVDQWHGDTSRMFYVGDVPIKSQNLVNTTYECMMKGISLIKNGVHLGDIGNIIQIHAEKEGFSVVRDFCGHGIGKNFHTAPNILHYGNKGEGSKLETGMVFTVEPMINEGKYHTKLLKDGWTAVTKDKLLSAQFEHTVGVTNEGFEIFTKSNNDYQKPPYLI